jgi:large subunit ribosomal protein L25
MDKTLSLQAEVREHTGSKAAAAIRQNGRIPAIVYGHKEEPVAISLDAHDFVEGLHHGHRLMDITVAGNTGKMIVKDVQYDHLGRRIIHVDLMRVDVTERIKMSVPIELKGTAKGTQEGGVVEQHMDHLDVECPVIAIPESFVVSVKDLDVGQVIHAGEIALPEDVKLLTPADTIMVSCRVLQEVKTTEQVEAETPAAPELIREREPEAEEEEAAGEK